MGTASVSPRSEGEFSRAWAKDSPAIPDPITATVRIGCCCIVDDDVRPYEILLQFMKIMVQRSSDSFVAAAGINVPRVTVMVSMKMNLYRKWQKGSDFASRYICCICR